MAAKTSRPGPSGQALPRRDILAICAFLNRPAAPRSIDLRAFGDPGSLLERLAAAARMQ